MATQQAWQEAMRLASAQHWEAARQAFGRILQQMPGHAPAHLQLSYIESLSGSARRARAHAVAASQGRRLPAPLMAELLARLRTFNETGAIERCLAGLPSLHSLDIRLLLSIASQWSYLNEQQRAMPFLDEALRADPDYPPTLVARGQVLTYLGRFDEAHDMLERCIARAPELAQAYWLLSRLRKATDGDHLVDAIRAARDRFPQKPDGAALFEYALHKELDDLGEFDGAWQALQLACSAKRGSLAYSTADSVHLIESLRGWMPRSTTHASPSDSPGVVPIFIVGMHRSGTTLLEQLLARQPDTAALGELYDFTVAMRHATDHHCRGVVDTTLVERAAQVDLGEVGRRYMEGLEWRLGGERACIDKLPSNFLNLGFICEALPDARILHMQRDAMDTAFSNLRELFSGVNAYSYDQTELADFHALYARMMAHWHQRYPGRILDVSYERLTSMADDTVDEVRRFCGLTAARASTDTDTAQRRGGRGVATASAVQVRGEVRRHDVPKWQPYSTRLDTLKQRLRAGPRT